MIGARYLVVGDYCPRPAEGMQVVTAGVVEGLRAAQRHVHWCHPGKLALRLAAVVLQRPTVIIFTHGPGRGVLLWSGLLKHLTGARIVWLAPRPELAGVPGWLFQFSRVDWILASRLAPGLERILTHCGGHYRQTVHGIDLQRYRPAPRARLAERFRLFHQGRPPCGPLLLHVGHIRRNRGLETLAAVKRALGDAAEMIVIGSPTFAPDEALLAELENAGVIVQRNYIDDLAACYRAADLYLFPVTDSHGGAIDLPLSVLEALACGTPVLSTPFGSLQDILQGLPGITFADAGNFATVCRNLIEQGGHGNTSTIGLPADFGLAALATKIIDVVEGDLPFSHQRTPAQ